MKFIRHVPWPLSSKDYIIIARRSNSPSNLLLINVFAKRLVKMYRQETSENWAWFESYLTYANSVLPEAMLYAWLLTSDKVYKDIALSSFDFLLSRTFNSTGIQVISNKKWLMKGQEPDPFILRRRTAY